jgi:hypothetical protein
VERASVAAVLAIVLVAVLVGRGNRSTTLVTASGSGTTTVEPPTTTEIVGGSLAIGVDSTTSAPTVATSLPTTTIRPVPTTRAPAPSTTRPRPPTTTSTTVYVAPQPRCTGDRLSLVVALDRPSYAPGQPVLATIHVRNNGPGVCWQGGFTDRVEYFNSAGVKSAMAMGGVGDALTDSPMAVGQDFTVQLSPWDQTFCVAATTPCPQAPPGTYTFRTTFTFAPPAVSATTNVVLVAH